jgi:hypothetical protein
VLDTDGKTHCRAFAVAGGLIYIKHPVVTMSSSSSKTEGMN